MTHRSLPESRAKGNGSGKKPGASDETDADVRAAMVSEANAMYDKGSHSSSYGPADLDKMLAIVIPKLDWQEGNGLQALVDLADTEGAYHETGRPSPGDIILFDNQRDANGNGKLDDKFTGCGVLIETDDAQLTLIGRTGHAPRKIVAWPGGPSRDRLNGNKINSFLRIPHRSDPPSTEYLAGRLFAGYIDIERLARSTR